MILLDKQLLPAPPHLAAAATSLTSSLSFPLSVCSSCCPSFSLSKFPFSFLPSILLLRCKSNYRQSERASERAREAVCSAEGQPALSQEERRTDKQQEGPRQKNPPGALASSGLALKGQLFEVSSKFFSECILRKFSVRKSKYAM